MKELKFIDIKVNQPEVLGLYFIHEIYIKQLFFPKYYARHESKSKKDII